MHQITSCMVQYLATLNQYMWCEQWAHGNDGWMNAKEEYNYLLATRHL